MIERTGDFAEVGTRTALGVAGAGYTYLGLPMGDWVGIATIIYLIVSTLKNLPAATSNVRMWIDKWRSK